MCNNMDEPGGHKLSEISQIEKDKYCTVSLICGIFKKKVKLRGREQNGGNWGLGYGGNEEILVKG